MHFKKFVALLLSAALALTVFAGCGSESLLQLLLDLLQNQYQNITITAEDDLEATLRQAVSKNDAIEDIDAALQEALHPTVSFEGLRSARAGDQTFDLVFKTGSDTEAMARQTYTDWNTVLGSLPSSGQYLADLATLKADNGYYILVNVTVKKGSSSSHDDNDDSNQLLTEIWVYDKDVEDNNAIQALKDKLAKNPITTVHFEVETQKIPANLFAVNPNVKTLTIPASANKLVEENAFADLKGKVTVKITGNGGIDASILGGIPDEAEVTLDLTEATSIQFNNPNLNGAFHGCKSIREVDMRGSTGVGEITNKAFYECSNLTTVDLSGCSKLTAIQGSAFYGCSSLESINLTGCTGLKLIGTGAFKGCTSLTEIDLRNCTSLNQIYPSAFEDLDQFTQLWLPAYPESGSIEIGGYAFNGGATTLDIYIPNPDITISYMSGGFNAFGGRNLILHCNNVENDQKTKLTNQFKGSGSGAVNVDVTGYSE